MPIPLSPITEGKGFSGLSQGAHRTRAQPATAGLLGNVTSATITLFYFRRVSTNQQDCRPDAKGLEDRQGY